MRGRKFRWDGDDSDFLGEALARGLRLYPLSKSATIIRRSFALREDRMSQDSLLLGKNQARRILVTLLAGGLLTFLVVTQARAQNNEEIVHIFGTGGGIDGADPYGGVVLDSAGETLGTATLWGCPPPALVG